MNEPHSYDVALSFADEQRTDAHQLAELLQSSRYRVFYDKWEEHQSLGMSLGIRLTQIYEHEARYCVILVSSAYVEKDIPRHELQAALARHMRERAGYILPVKYDDTPIPGLASDTVYLDRRKATVEQIAGLIGKRLGTPASAPPRHDDDPWLRVYPSGYISIVIVKGGDQGVVLNFDCHLTNRGPAALTVQHLEARFTGPDTSPLGLSWNVFYAQSPLDARSIVRQHMTGVAQPLTLQPGESRLLGIQFSGPPLGGRFRWRRSPYSLRFSGLVRRRTVAEQLDLGTSFAIRPTPEVIATIDYWSRAGDAPWRDLDDPDNAVGIPLVVEGIQSRFPA